MYSAAGDPMDPPEQGAPSNALAALERFQQVDRSSASEPPSRPAYPALRRTSVSRLSQPDASPTPFPAEPVLSTGETPNTKTVLYLAYGSNLSAQVFQGTRGIKPLSAVAVSAPSVDLVFDFPGLPYREPCFANAALRKIPKPPVPIPDPPKLPPEIPDLPDPPIKPPHWQLYTGTSDGVERNAAGDPVWNKGMIGVVYEVTREDYATIIKTEGGGVSYQDIFVPCLPLPPSMHVPEKPQYPELPRPFLAHTLLAPRLPDDPRSPGAKDGDDGDEPEKPHPKLPSWARNLMLPVRRPDPDYSQASARYLGLIVDGAKEHDLPSDYQAYLNALRPYTLTTRRQEIGRFLFYLLWSPILLILLAGRLIFADKETGRIVPWMAAVWNVFFNLSWLSYDYIAKPLFGDGERTEPEEEKGRGGVRLEGERPRPSNRWLLKESILDEEKRCLIYRDASAK